MNRLLFIVCVFACTIGVLNAPVHGDDPQSDLQLVSAATREQALEVLQRALETEHRWIKVHAAEFLLELSYPTGVYEAFEAERKSFESEPKYRIGIWRVLSRATVNQTERQQWIESIRAVVLDPESTDKIHALETLAKLGDNSQDPALRDAVVAVSQVDAVAPYGRWLLTHWGLGKSNQVDQVASLFELLNSPNSTSQLVAAYGLQWMRTHAPHANHPALRSPQILAALRKAAERGDVEPAAKAYLHSAAWVLSPGNESTNSDRDQLLVAAKRNDATARIVAATALAERGTGEDVPLLLEWLQDSNADVRVHAAAALLRIGRRDSHHLGPLDWGVLALYFTGMVGIGWFYSLGNKTTDDYLLGGRNMSAWTVGLSLFATLCSTISYLSTPGEMIQYGPMFLTSIIAYPFVTVVVGWWLIPYFMKLPVTSAYEILESRLGLGVRLLGAFFFLAMRLLWMAVILDVTTKVVLLPILGLDPAYSPAICAVLGLSTVIYSSLGGIRAVVMTDVVQTFILLAGAIAALGLITWNLGGVSAWWPTTWAENWDPPTLGFDPSSRMSLGGVFIATFFWYLCTAGSDQMAIQRYLATRDVRSARRMFNISMISGVVVTTLLSFLGLGLLAWFRSHPEMLGEGQTIAQNGDQLFPRFIVAGLPEGVSGLVIAGLLAAAMSSLSSGLSSSTAVITVDFFDRLTSMKPNAGGEVRRARLVSWTLGLVVVLLSTVVGLVQGNVLELAFKVVNLLVSPLFGLFFMALFVRWATSFGTFVGAAFGLATVVAINYWTEFTGQAGISFLWSTPLGLLIQIVVGSVASLLPFGTSRPLRSLE